MASDEVDGFYKIMQKTHIVYKTAMVIPKSFYEKHSSQLANGVQLQHKTGGHVWPGVVVPGPCEGHQIARGWKQFVEDNKLEISEILVFKVPPDAPREGPLLLKFQVFDAVDGVGKPPVTVRGNGRTRVRKSSHIHWIDFSSVSMQKRRNKHSVSSLSSSAPSQAVALAETSETGSESSEPTHEETEE